MAPGECLAGGPQSIPGRRRGCGVQSPETASWREVWRDFATPLFLLRKICSSRLPGCHSINISAVSRRLLSWALTPREVTPGSEKRPASGRRQARVAPAAAARGPGPAVPPVLPAAAQLPPVPRNRCAEKGGLGSGVRSAHDLATPLCPPLWASLARAAPQPASGISAFLRVLLPRTLYLTRSLSAFKAPLWYHLLQEAPTPTPTTGWCPYPVRGCKLWFSRVYGRHFGRPALNPGWHRMSKSGIVVEK